MEAEVRLRHCIMVKNYDLVIGVSLKMSQPLTVC
jgi:hypothetical protein